MINPTQTPRIHVVIGDTQVKPGVPTQHLSWIGQYLVEHFAGQDITIVHVGDHADMPSLSSYDKGKKEMEGRRYKKDISAANTAWDLLNEPLYEYNRTHRRRWLPEKVITLGNHEHRIVRAAEDDAQLDGMLSLGDLNYETTWGWKVVPFLKVYRRDGVSYSHYFVNPMSGRPYSGENMLLRLKTIGRSFTMGHQQGMHVAHRYVGPDRHMALVNGSCYLHDEMYLSPQGNHYWRGIVVCHRVQRGQYDRMEVGLDYLCERYEGVPLKRFMKTWS